MKTYKSISLSIIISFSFLMSSAQNISPNVINSSGQSFQTSTYGMDVNIGEPTTGLIANGNNQITQGFLQPDEVILDLKMFIQGYYLTSVHKMRACLYLSHVSTDTNACDYVTIELHDPIQPVSAQYSFKAILHTDGKAEFIFPYAVFNHSYFLVIRHRNTVETWSKEPILFDSRLISYDFTM